MMQYVGRRYVPYINTHYGTNGTLWEGCYKASLVQEEDYLLTCMRYIEPNPVRLLPTTSVDEFGATFAKWMGAFTSELGSVFPNLSRFPRANGMAFLV